MAFSELHALALADMDGDGLKDIVVGKRWWSHGDNYGSPDAYAPPALHWFKLVRSIGPRGGVAVTAGGLIFSGTNSDSTIRAYDKDTGKVLWEKKLPSAPEGIPAVYAVGGREYVIMSAVASKAASANPDEEAPVRQATAISAPENNPGIQGYYVFCRAAKLT